MKFSPISAMATANWASYSTCRGKALRPTDQVLDRLWNATDAEVDSNDEVLTLVDTYLWDLYCHQYTLYSGTPLFLDALLSRSQNTATPSNAAACRFIQHCQTVGTRGIHFSTIETTLNLTEVLPFFRIEDVLAKWRPSKDVP